MPLRQIFYQAFRGNKEFVRHCVPRTDKQAFFRDQFCEPFYVFRADCQVVVEDACLPVQGKYNKIRILFKCKKDAVHNRDEHKTELIQGFVPFPIPVGGGEIVDCFRVF